MATNRPGRCCARNYILDTILNTIPTDSCDTICLTITDLADLPDPLVCDFVYYSPIDQQAAAYYVYNTGLAQWDAVYNIISVTQTGPTFTGIRIDLLTGWSFSVDGGSTWIATAGVHVINTPAPMTVRVRNDANGCVYVGQTLFFVSFAMVEDPNLLGFAGWTFVGGWYQEFVPPFDTVFTTDFAIFEAVAWFWEDALGASSYNAINRPFSNPDIDSYRFFTYMGNGTPPDMQILDDLANPYTPTWSSLLPSCQSVSFTVTDPALTVPLSTGYYGVDGFGDYTGAPDFSDPTAMAAFLLAGRFSFVNTPYGSSSVDVQVVGNDITITLEGSFFIDTLHFHYDDNGSPFQVVLTQIDCP